MIKDWTGRKKCNFKDKIFAFLQEMPASTG